MSSAYLTWANEAMHTEAEAICVVAGQLGEDFVHAIDVILRCSGRTIVMGMGKSGHIGRKISATFASTGTPSFFVHPAEAAHGDLGMIVDGDVVLALSNSGESDEILDLIPALKRKHITLICITSNPKSNMAQHADIHILARITHEACPLGLAPTSSTTAVLALGDAMAVALLKARSFTSKDFALSHPAGSLGRRLLITVGDLMHTGKQLPAVLEHTLLKIAVVIMSEKALGMIAVIDKQGKLCGILTDGDLRRLFETHDNFANLTVNDVMKPHATTISPDKLASEAIKLMQEKRISGLLVCNEQKQLIGALNMHDLLRARLV